MGITRWAAHGYRLHTLRTLAGTDKARLVLIQETKERLAAEGLPVVPMTVFAKGAHYALEELSNTPYDVVGLDWTMDPADAVRRTGGRVTLQGM